MAEFGHVQSNGPGGASDRNPLNTRPKGADQKRLAKAAVVKLEQSRKKKVITGFRKK